uniref:Dystroglycan-type cadherin-like domain-containing protein n=1 Tax=mine drainage metagenome TaxID=410659 RepID=E6PXF5_9ZZZZ
MQRAAVQRTMWSFVTLLAGLGMFGVLLGVSGCGGSSAPLGITVTASASTVDGTDSVTLTATVANDKNSAGVKWTLSGAGTLSSQTTSAATYTAPAATSSAQTATITATSIADATKSSTTTLTVPAAPAITTSSLGQGSVGVAYSVTLAASGGVTPYTWSLSSGTLPASLSLTSAGVLSGTPMAGDVGTYNLTFMVTDAGKATALTATQALSLSINPAPAIAFSTTTLATADYKVAYSATVAATGGAGTLTYAVASGALPTGLTLSPMGALSGMPTVTGTFAFSVKAADAYGDSMTQSFSLKVVYPTLTITTASLPTAYVGTSYTQTLAATGGSEVGYAWTVSSGSTLPAGLALSTAGVLSGTATISGTPSFGVTVTDSAANTANMTYKLTINPALSVTTATTLPTGFVGTSYSQQLAATGGSGTGYTWSLASGTPPAGLTLSTTGLIAGSPTTAGMSSFSAKVVDSAGNAATANFSIQVYAAFTLSTPSTTVPGPGTVGGVYSGTIMATGGSGSYAWTITGLPSDGISASPSGGTVTLSGTPTTATTVSFTASVKDTVTNLTLGPNTYSIVVSNPAPLTLPSSNPSSLPSGTVNQSYSGSIMASGGAGPYTWAINGTTVTGAGLALSNGLSASNSGGNTLTITGTPTTTTAVPLTSVTVKDNTSTTAGPTSYSISVNAAGSQVSGQISLNTNCGGGGTVPPITVSISTSPVQTTTTDGSGNYSFASIPNGTYTITPSISGASSIFFPATESVTVNNGTVTGQNFAASLGYTVSGTVSYSGTNKGQVYVTLENGGCGGSSEGTSITESTLTSGGAFTIHGVPPGSYSVSANMDVQGQGGVNAADPTSSSVNGSVTNANVTGVSLPLTDPTVGTPTAAPGLHTFSPINLGVIISFKPITNSNGVEQVTSYTVEWSTSSSFSSPSSATFKAVGDKTNIWVLDNGTAGITGSFSNGTAYYFRARGNVTAGSGPWAVWGGGTPTAVTVGAPSGSGYFTVSGTVTLPSGIAPTGPLYVGFYDQSLEMVYATEIASPSNSSPNAYTVSVPSGSNYFFFGILDQNNNGVVDEGDVSNTGEGNGSSSAMSITSSMTGQNLTLPSTNSTATVTTQNQQFTSSGGSSHNYNLNFNVRESDKLPVSVTVTSGPNVINPIDLALCSDCGHVQFNYWANLSSTQPNVGDAYTFLVTYSDGTSETVNGSVTGVSTAFATGLTPSGSVPGETTPTFTWTDPASASSYTYQFYLTDNNGNMIWQIPGNNSNSGNFSSSITSITWGTDPTSSNNSPSVPSLTTGATYNWQLTVQDSNGNQATTGVSFIP